MDSFALPAGASLQGGRYRIVRFIGSGGFGCTYEALRIEDGDVSKGQKVAVKEFFVKDFCNRDEGTWSVTVGTQNRKPLVEKIKRKFIDEARVLAGFDCPGIVHVSDAFEENGTAYYVMDYIEGRSLQEIVQQEGRLDERRAMKYIRQTADALQYVHSNNRLHLDIKPGNIMVDKDDNAVLIDFGASKQYDEESGENTSTLMGMTPGYAPPEQMGNNVTKFLPATDIYALGATLYKLLTGVTPPSANEIIAGEAAGRFPSSVSGEARRAVSKAMALNKSERPQSVSGFVSMLPGRERKKFSFKWLKTVAAVAAAVLVVCLIAIVMPVDTLSVSESRYPIRQSGGHEQLPPDGLDGFTYGLTGEADGRGYVDLGLSVNWAACNIGAAMPSGYGDYISADTLDTMLGNGWRLPDADEAQELIDMCEWTWTVLDGHKGYTVTGPNGNSIFLPASGWRNGDLLHNAGDTGMYLTSSVDDVHEGCMNYLCFYDSSNRLDWWSGRYGRSVRPVFITD